MKFILSVALFLSMLTGRAQNVIPLYPGTIPNAKVSDRATTPTLTVFLPPAGQANGTAIIVCPGGGYSQLVIDREGTQVAKAFANLGATTFVLTYRLPNDTTMVNKTIGPLQDAQQAIKTVRERAAEWGVDSTKIGMIGFSAGGHLAAMAGTRFTKNFIDNPTGTSLRPDFLLLIYPVISFSYSLVHLGSRDHLVGLSPSADLVWQNSAEMQVSAKTPPTLLLHANDDQRVPVANSIRFYEAMQRFGVPGELHLYPTGGHGFGRSPAKEDWLNQCTLWLKKMGWLKA